MISNKFGELNKTHMNRPVIFCHTIITLSYELIDSFKNEEIFHLRNIYENSIMSENRKNIENLQTKLIETIEDVMAEDLLPVELSDVRYVDQKIYLDVKNQFLDNISKDTPMEGVVQFLFELQTALFEILENKRLENEEVSKVKSRELVSSILQQFNKVEDLTIDDLRSPMLMDNLEELMISLLEQYEESAKGPYKCKNRMIDRQRDS